MRWCHLGIRGSPGGRTLSPTEPKPGHETEQGKARSSQGAPLRQCPPFGQETWTKQQTPTIQRPTDPTGKTIQTFTSEKDPWISTVPDWYKVLLLTTLDISQNRRKWGEKRLPVLRIKGGLLTTDRGPSPTRRVPKCWKKEGGTAIGTWFAWRRSARLATKVAQGRC